MLFLQRIPAAPLAPFIRMLWYARADSVAHHRERVLPNGCVQVILNLARDYLLDCPEDRSDIRMPPALVIGARSVYEIVDGRDMADLVGIVFSRVDSPPLRRMRPTSPATGALRSTAYGEMTRRVSATAFERSALPKSVSAALNNFCARASHRGSIAGRAHRKSSLPSATSRTIPASPA